MKRIFHFLLSDYEKRFVKREKTETNRFDSYQKSNTVCQDTINFYCAKFAFTAESLYMGQRIDNIYLFHFSPLIAR